ncbi:MAG: AAA family ATPase [Candidatus Cloacimonetes bacterium]|nr:AAA family ATPase [Candidatus Cloacimonadota bacterium]
MKYKRTPIGISDFKKLRVGNCYWIDKSLFIKDVVESAEVLLYPRPRRFGKTINLSMLRYFYDCREDNSSLFSDLAISQEAEIMQKQGKYPVIFFTFKDVKGNDFEQCLDAIRLIISQLYLEHIYLLDSDFMHPFEKFIYNQIIEKKSNQAELEHSIKKLGDFLKKYHKENPVILIDEYDMPIHSAYLNGYYEHLITFIRNMLSACLKDNVVLEKAVLTGILRVAKESIFSGLNNLKVNSILSKESSDRFGFTDKEVEKCLKDYDLSDKLQIVKDWYDGYNFYDHEIYNPWSILNFIMEKQIKPYWVNTSGNDLIKLLLQKANSTTKKDLEILVEKGTLSREIQDNIVYGEIENNTNSLWNFLLMSGYLRYDNLVENYFSWSADLKIPNKEVQYLFETQVIKSWFNLANQDIQLDNVLDELTRGDLDSFIKAFTDFCLDSFSYFDVSGNEPERFYHAFVLGMITSLRPRYTIRSNRESGYGRYDIMMIPADKNQRGFIFEFKKIDQYEKENFETALQNAKNQVVQKNYARELLDQGIQTIVYVVAVFDKKEVKAEWFV